MKIYQNILVVRTDRMGDVILTTPALKALRLTYPKAKITLLVAKIFEPMVRDNPYIDEVMIDRREGHNGLGGFFDMVNDVKSKQFDLAVNFHTKKRTNALLFLAGIPRRIGWNNKKWSFLLNDKCKDERHLGKKHETEYCLDLLKIVGVTHHTQDLFVPVSESAQQWVKRLFQENQFGFDTDVILIHPTASDQTRVWSPQAFSEVIQVLGQKPNTQIVLVGVKSNKDMAREIARQCDIEVFDLTGLTSIPQLIALCKESKFLISMDSGPVHLASALQTPVVSVFTRNRPGINPERWKPLSKNSITISPEVGVDPSNENDPVQAMENLEKKQIPQVLEAVDALYKLC